jgi:hypothetical protein
MSLIPHQWDLYNLKAQENTIAQAEMKCVPYIGTTHKHVHKVNVIKWSPCWHVIISSSEI